MVKRIKRCNSIPTTFLCNGYAEDWKGKKLSETMLERTMKILDTLASLRYLQLYSEVKLSISLHTIWSQSIRQRIMCKNFICHFLITTFFSLPRASFNKNFFHSIAAQRMKLSLLPINLCSSFSLSARKTLFLPSRSPERVFRENFLMKAE